jgi:hypothetical protein
MQETGGTDTLSDYGGNDAAIVAYVVTKFEKSDYDLIITSTHDSKLTIKDYFRNDSVSGLIEHLWLGGYSKDWSIPGRTWTREEILAVVTEVVTEEDVLDGGGVSPPHSPEIETAPETDWKTLFGKSGKTVLKGSSAADIFVFTTAKTAGLGKHRDVLLGFEHGVDRIDLSGIDSNTKAAGNNAFKTLLSSKKAFSKAGQLRYDNKTGILSGNTDKDKAAEFELVLKNKPKTLQLSDFDL